MVGVGKFIKQAQKMQKKMELVQQELKNKVIAYSAGGGAVNVKVNGHGDALELKIDGEFLKEEKTVVEETILEAFRQALSEARKINSQATQEVSGGLDLPFAL